MSARQSPPNASDRARSSTTLPGSWIASGLRHGANAADNPVSSPAAATVTVSSTPPACPTAPERLVSTWTQDRTGYPASPERCSSNGLDRFFDKTILAGQGHFSVDQHTVTRLSRESPGLAHHPDPSQLTPF